MSEQITVYRLRSGPLSCDASFYCAAVKRSIHHRGAPLYGPLFLIRHAAEQRPRQHSPSRRAENAPRRPTEGARSNTVPSKDGKMEGGEGGGSKEQGGRPELAASVGPLLVGNNGNKTVQQTGGGGPSSLCTGWTGLSKRRHAKPRFITTAHISKHNISFFFCTTYSTKHPLKDIFLCHSDNTHYLFAGEKRETTRLKLECESFLFFFSP